MSGPIDKDNARFAAIAIQRWWQKWGRVRYPRARSLLVVAPAGSGKRDPAHLWNTEIHRLTMQTGLQIDACELPYGLSRWNGFENQFFLFAVTGPRHGQRNVEAAIVSTIRGTGSGIAPTFLMKLETSMAAGSRPGPGGNTFRLPAGTVWHTP